MKPTELWSPWIRHWAAFQFHKRLEVIRGTTETTREIRSARSLCVGTHGNPQEATSRAHLPLGRRDGLGCSGARRRGVGYSPTRTALSSAYGAGFRSPAYRVRIDGSAT